jgi:hypothetical protein
MDRSRDHGSEGEEIVVASQLDDICAYRRLLLCETERLWPRLWRRFDLLDPLNPLARAFKIDFILIAVVILGGADFLIIITILH